MDRLSPPGVVRRMAALLRRLARGPAPLQYAPCVVRTTRVSAIFASALLVAGCGETPTPQSTSETYTQPPGILRVTALDEVHRLSPTSRIQRVGLQEFVDNTVTEMPVRLPPVEDDPTLPPAQASLDYQALTRLPAVVSSDQEAAAQSAPDSLPAEMPSLSKDRYADYPTEQPAAQPTADVPELELAAPQVSRLPEIALDEPPSSDPAPEEALAAAPVVEHDRDTERAPLAPDDNPPLDDAPVAPAPRETEPIVQSEPEPTGELAGPSLEAPATPYRSESPVETAPVESVAEVDVRRLPEVLDPTPAAVEALAAERAKPQPARRAVRPPGMHAVAQKAADHVRAGFSLANRGAMYSARDEFITALRLISQALDTTSTDRHHTLALARGLRALRESDDFVPRAARVEADLNVPAIVAAHRTTVLHEVDPTELTALVARRSYYTYAQEQLAEASGGERSGSMALYGLARIYSSLAESNSDQHATATPKAMALHQAALLVDGQNYMAANELAVILAQHSQFETAKALLEQSLASVPQPAAWQNLAHVYARLGRRADATYAANQAVLLAQRVPTDTGPTASRAPVAWASPEEFARSTQTYQPQATARGTSSPATR